MSFRSLNITLDQQKDQLQQVMKLYSRKDNSRYQQEQNI
ncbi:hypothetical protein pb186bvf_016930 [Paramecium bursaria]